jgi:hypothetical protein
MRMEMIFQGMSMSFGLLSRLSGRRRVTLYLATMVAHTRARPHNPARRMLSTPKNRNQTMVWRIRTCPHSLPRRSARNAIPVAVLRQAAALKDRRALL